MWIIVYFCIVITTLAHSTDKSNRGVVVGGKQLDGFIGILKNLALSVGINESCIYTKNNYLPGYFRSSKDWDFIILTPSNKLLVAIELKSQVGSYGNELSWNGKYLLNPFDEKGNLVDLNKTCALTPRFLLLNFAHGKVVRRNGIVVESKAYFFPGIFKMLVSRFLQASFII